MLKECAACGVNFEARNSRQKTCSITCGRHMMHARLRKERGTPRTCAHCGTEWIAMPKDKSKFCSWECHAADKNHGPTHVVECEECGASFKAWHSRVMDGRGRFCSKECHYLAHQKRVSKYCECCGQVFDVQESYSDARFCGRECYKIFTNDSRSPHWKGGSWVSSKGFRMIYSRRPGYSTKYDTEHRIVAARAIGRPVETHEIVIHLDRDKLNNAPENLYIFGSRSDWVRVQLGPASSWPAKSNLDIWERSNPPTRLE